MRRLRLALTLLPSLVASACADAPPPPPSTPPVAEVVTRRWTISPAQEAFARLEPTGCWITGTRAGTPSSLSLRLPAAACRGDEPPAWLDAEELRSESASPVVHLYEPIPFLPGEQGLALARRFLARELALHPKLAEDEGYRAARWSLELYGDDGAIDDARAPALCDAGNAVACLHGADAASWAARAERACLLGLSGACRELAYRRYLGVLEAARETPAFAAYFAEWCSTCRNAPSNGPAIAACSADTRVFGARPCPAAPAIAPPPPARAGSRAALVAGAGAEERSAALASLRREVFAAVRRTPAYASLLALVCAKTPANVSLATGALGVNDGDVFEGQSCAGAVAAPVR